MKLNSAQKKLREYATEEDAESLARYFKTGPGQYGEGDQFIGVTVPEMTAVAKKFAFEISDSELTHLLSSPIHEDRCLALKILVLRYARAKSLTEKKKITEFYLDHLPAMNNWDLVDLSCYKLLGLYCLETGKVEILRRLSRSKRHWDKRIAIVSTLAFIREKKCDLTYEFAEQFLDEQEDLMHKATGWMLREAGKRDPDRLRSFIKKFGKRMPRTMLRYSIEKFSANERKKILTETKT